MRGGMGGGVLSGGLVFDGPAVEDLLKGGGVEVVELVAAFTARGDEAGELEDGEVLGDGLAGGGEVMLHGEAGAELEEGLAIAVGQLVEDGAPRGVGERIEQVRHGQ